QQQLRFLGLAQTNAGPGDILVSEFGHWIKVNLLVTADDGCLQKALGWAALGTTELNCHTRFVVRPHLSKLPEAAENRPDTGDCSRKWSDYHLQGSFGCSIDVQHFVGVQDRVAEIEHHSGKGAVGSLTAAG